MRDVIARFAGNKPFQVSCPDIADVKQEDKKKSRPGSAKVSRRWIIWRSTRNTSPRRLVPQKENPKDVWFDEIKPLRSRSGADREERLEADRRLVSLDEQADRARAAGNVPSRVPALRRSKEAGYFAAVSGRRHQPERTGLLRLVRFVAKPMLGLLHFFYHLVHNYGLAIVMLTVLVRGCMFPLSRRQAQSSQKMAELKPEIQRIQEKYKDPAQRNKAMQELYRKHNFNPFGGCLLMFVQLPIFVGLVSLADGRRRAASGTADLGLRSAGARTWLPPTCCGTGIARRAGVYAKAISAPI